MSKLSYCGMCIVVAVGVSVMGTPLPSMAETACPSFPKVSFWGKLTHESTRQHVKDNLKGDWGAYLERLQRHQKTLRKIHKRGSGAVIKRKGRKIKLSGKLLAKYLRYGDERLAVVRCLADSEETQGLGDFSTAAGNPADKPRDNASKAAPGGKASISRTFITMPKNLLKKIRKMAVRQSVKDGKKIAVSDIVVEILERELKRRKR